VKVCAGRATAVASTCPGWRQLDNSPQLLSIFSGPAGLYETRVSTEGQETLYSIWVYLGPACSGGSCPGWFQIDMTGTEPGWIAVGYYSAYELEPNDDVRQFTGQLCGSNGCPGWLEVGSNPYTQTLTAANSLFQTQQTYSTNTVWLGGARSMSSTLMARFASLPASRVVLREDVQAGRSWIRIRKSSSSCPTK
jgi:hypothetical protein